PRAVRSDAIRAAQVLAATLRPGEAERRGAIASCNYFVRGGRITHIPRPSLVTEPQIMTRAVLLLLALATITPISFAQDFPPPRKLGDEFIPQPPGPALVPPQAAQNPQQQPAQHAPQQPAAPAAVVGPATKRTPAQWAELFAARRRAENERQQARIDRMNQ